MKTPASFFVPSTVKVGLNVAPISYVPVTVEFKMIVGIVYVGRIVGNKISSNNSTKFFPYSSPAVVPASIPPTAVETDIEGFKAVL